MIGKNERMRKAMGLKLGFYFIDVFALKPSFYRQHVREYASSLGRSTGARFARHSPRLQLDGALLLRWLWVGAGLDQGGGALANLVSADGFYFRGTSSHFIPHMFESFHTTHV